MTDSFQQEAHPNIGDPFRFLQKAMTNAHHAILDYSAKHHLSDSPRTTCVACVIQDSVAYWAHAGDSRLSSCAGARFSPRPAIIPASGC